MFGIRTYAKMHRPASKIRRPVERPSPRLASVIGPQPANSTDAACARLVRASLWVACDQSPVGPNERICPAASPQDARQSHCLNICHLFGLLFAIVNMHGPGPGRHCCAASTGRQIRRRVARQRMGRNNRSLHSFRQTAARPARPRPAAQEPLDINCKAQAGICPAATLAPLRHSIENRKWRQPDACLAGRLPSPANDSSASAS